MRGGTDIRNLRRGRPNIFYAIYVDKQTLTVKGVDRRLAANDEYKNDVVPENCLVFIPLAKTVPKGFGVTNGIQCLSTSMTAK